MIDRMALLFASLHHEPVGGAPEWIVVGLGNPGMQYEGTRHNAGFAALDMLSAKYGIRVEQTKFKALCGMAQIAGKPALLMKPQTFMNLSGESVAAAARFYKLPMSHVLVLFDDISLPVGKLRVRRKGSAGGHNGIKSIIGECGTSEFPRIKIGVGDKPRPDYDLASWVLGRFAEDDQPMFAQSLERTANAVEELLQNGVGAAMNLYNA